MRNCIPKRILAAHPRAGKLLATFILATLLAAQAASAALQYQRLKSFGDASQAGRTPVGRLLEGSAGALYGTTPYTTTEFDFKGVVFRVNKDGTDYRVLHHFGGTGDGAGLYSGLVTGHDGALYGTTVNGGNAGAGTVFKLNHDGGDYAVLRHFLTNGVDGRGPGELLLATNGVFYGTTGRGGAYTNAAGGQLGLGTVFKLNQDGSGYAILHQFGSINQDGGPPNNILVQGGDGALYGTTKLGGSNNLGTVFKLQLNGSGYVILHHFSTNAPDGREPNGLLAGTDGALYGTTLRGGTDNFGTVFRLNGDGSGFAILHDFDADSGDGLEPAAGLAEGPDGSLCGTTLNGGTNYAGTVFKLKQDGSGYSILHHFSASPDGETPGAALIHGSDGILYGATERGGVNVDPIFGSGAGTLFKLNPDGGGYAVFHHFQADFSGEGANPNRLLDGSDGKLYGTTQQGGANGGGTVFRVNRDGSGFTSLHHFGSVLNDGYWPRAGLVEGSDGRLFGTTIAGGSNGVGTVFRLNKDGSGLSILHHFTGAWAGTSSDGAQPITELLEGNDGTLYGTTTRGGTYTNEFGASGGTVFKLNKDGTGYGILRQFGSSASDGLFPQAGLVEGSDGVLYGTAYLGGSSGWGTVFKLNKNGSGYTTLHHFGIIANDGQQPFAPLVEGSDGVLYGTTEGGGSYPSGTVFKMDKNGAGYSVLHHFGGVGDGAIPSGGLTEASDGALYGTTTYGNNDLGTVFKINKDGSAYAIAHAFTSSNARVFPYAGLIKGTDGTLYGTTQIDGEVALGTVYKLSWPVVITRYERNGNTAQLGWSGVPNWPYRYEVCTNSLGPNATWLSFTTNYTGADGTIQITVPEPPNTPARFYRIVWP